MKCWLLIGAFYETIPFEEARLRRKSLAVSSPRTPFLAREAGEPLPKIANYPELADSNSFALCARKRVSYS
jgi:hypothetical protein